MKTKTQRWTIRSISKATMKQAGLIASLKGCTIGELITALIAEEFIVVAASQVNKWYTDKQPDEGEA